MKIVFMGTPDFAVPSLDILVKNGYEVAAVVTQPDKPKGRGNKLTPPPVKEYALNNNIPILQPEKVKTGTFAQQLREIAPDLLVTVAYGRILPQEVLDIPPYGCVNVHGSLLPKYRGAAPIQWSVINGDSITGITTMYTDIGMDTGDMLLKREVEIHINETAGELHDKLSVIGAEVLLETLKELEKGTLVRIPQPADEATYVTMISKETGCIDWSKTMEQIHNLVRGTDPWPGAYTFYKGERMRVWKTECSNIEKASKPGEIIEVKKEGILVGTGKGNIILKEIQFDSGKRLKVEQYLAGHSIDKGELLG